MLIAILEQLEWLGFVHKMIDNRLTKKASETRTQSKKERDKPWRNCQGIVRKVTTERSTTWEEIKQAVQDCKLCKKLIKTSSTQKSNT